MEIRECTRSLWQIFRQYHYLNTTLVSSNKNFTALYNGKPVAFISVGRSQYKARYWLVSRLVVLPDYQGIGIGTRLLTHVAKHFHDTTRQNFFITSSNPQLIHLRKNPHWILNRFGHVHGQLTKHPYAKTLCKSNSKKRLTFSFKYKP